jgi:hypothetical protein
LHIHLLQLPHNRQLIHCNHRPFIKVFRIIIITVGGFNLFILSLVLVSQLSPLPILLNEPSVFTAQNLPFGGWQELWFQISQVPVLNIIFRFLFSLYQLPGFLKLIFIVSVSIFKSVYLLVYLLLEWQNILLNIQFNRIII